MRKKKKEPSVRKMQERKREKSRALTVNGPTGERDELTRSVRRLVLLLLFFSLFFRNGGGALPVPPLCLNYFQERESFQLLAGCNQDGAKEDPVQQPFPSNLGSFPRLKALTVTYVLSADRRPPKIT
jgi:hypothetical protein